MTKTVIINGSPKVKDSASSIFIDKVTEFLEIEPIIYQAIQLTRKEDNSKELFEILNADVLLFVFPLYVDSLPAPLIKLLNIIEEERIDKDGKYPKVYAIANCGFLEAEHNQIALDIIKNFSNHLGMLWGYGIGLGGGSYLASNRKNISKKGSASDVYITFCELAKAIENNLEKKQNIFITPKIPQSLYKLSGNLGWYLMAIKHGSLMSLKAKPHTFKK